MTSLGRASISPVEPIRVTNDLLSLDPLLRWRFIDIHYGVTEGAIDCCMAARGEHIGHSGHRALYWIYAGSFR